MKYLYGILATSLMVSGVISSTTRSFFPAVIAIAEYFGTQAYTDATSIDWTSTSSTISWPFFEGLVLGLQQDSTNTDHECYVAFTSLESDIGKLPAYIQTVTGEDDSDYSNGNTIMDALPLSSIWFQPGLYFKLFKRGQELSSLFFDLYE